MNLSTKFTEENILSLIRNKVEEGQTIDYKGSNAFNDEKWKQSICTDVSAFANAVGGIIVYGVTEHEESMTGKKIKVFPQAIDGGIDPALISKESIVQVLQDGIQRPVHLYFDVVPLTGFEGKVAYVLRIPQSIDGPHQVIRNGENRYYQRYETQNNRMQDWQIRDVANRRTGPDLLLQCSLDLKGKQWFQTDEYHQSRFQMQMLILNVSKNPASHIILNLYIDNRLRFLPSNQPQTAHTPKILPNGCSAITYSYQLTPNIPLFDSLPFNWNGMSFVESPVSFEFRENFKANTVYDYEIEWELLAPNMLPRRGLERITYSVSQDHLLHQSIGIDELNKR